MHTTSVFVRPVLREMWRHIRDQQKKIDALELLVMNLLEAKKEECVSDYETGEAAPHNTK